MRLWGIFRFELSYQARRAWPWLILAALLVVSFLMARDNALADAMYAEFYANSPFAIAKTTVIAGMLWLLAGPVLAGEAAARDVATGMHPLTWTAPVSKGEYLGGRFLAALAINAALLFAVQVGIVAGVYSPGIAPQVIGPFRPAAFLTAYAYLSLPSAFTATALQFALATRSGRAMSAYLGSLLLVFIGMFISALLLYERELGKLLDPIGMRYVLDDLAREWTTIEKSTRLLSLQGTVLANRLLWLAVGMSALALTYARFRFAHRVEGRSWLRGRTNLATREARTPAPHVPSAVAPVAIPQVTRANDLATHVRRTFDIARMSFGSIARSLPGLAVLVGIPAMTVFVVLAQMSAMGAPLVPSTARVLRELTGGLSAELAAEPSRWIIVPLFIVYFAGELVWRERDAGIAEITDAMPVSEWTPLVGKLLGLGLLLAAFEAMLMLAGITGQLLLGRRDLEIGLYLQVLFGLQLPEYFLFAVLAVVVHVLADQKYVGHLAAILAYAIIAALAPMLGLEHNLLVYDRGPGWAYTEMRGYGATLGPWLWFKLYWTAWALLLAVAARLMWVRGREGGFGARLREARMRLTRATTATAAVALALVVATGGYIFYNTNILNHYRTAAEVEELRADYERRYRRYESVAQPRLTATSLGVDLRPERRFASIVGTHRLVNGHATAIDSIYVVMPMGGIETRALSFDRPARLVLDDRERGWRTYALGSPLAPGDTLRMEFNVRLEPRGFGNRGADRAIVPNGSAFRAETWLPWVGYQRSRELLTTSSRREHDLAPRPILGSLYDVEGSEPATRGGGVDFEALIGTSEDQVAVAPGELKRTWTEGGRRWFRYASSAPIGNEWPIFSARFVVHEERVGAVTVRIYHHPTHGAHVERTMRAVRDALGYYGAQYGRYPWSHLAIVEYPGAPGNSAHADASIVTHGESFAAWTPREGRLDMPYFVMAHEMGHEFGLPYALVEGLPFMAEGLATYQAMQLVKVSRGDAQFRRLQRFLRLPYPYPPIRHGEPLLRALDPHMARRWGPFAMYALTEYMGADQVNGAIRRLAERSDATDAKPVTTLDLYGELKLAAPDSVKPLLHDLFEVNTLWRLSVAKARADSLPDGSWRLTMDVEARKFVYDSAGVETDVPMDEPLQIGVFGPGDKGDELSAPLYVQTHRVRSGRQTITVTVKGKPVLTGVDPYHLLDWDEKEDDDNLRRVETGGS